MIYPGALQPQASARSIAAITSLLEERTGQQIAANRVWRIEASLKPVLRDRGLASLDELADGFTRSGDAGLCDAVVEALLNQETSFFRDAGVIDLVAAASGALHREAPGRRVRLWSAGCSNGQEPLSLAMLCEEAKLGAEACEIVATDVSQAAIARAREARYTQFEIQRGLSVRRMMAWFDSDDGEWVARRDLVRRVRYRPHNLIGDAPLPGSFDVILCRNLLLYFSPELRRRAFDRLADALRPAGLLVLGAGETVIGQTERFVPSPRWRGLYLRTPDPSAG